MNCGGEAYSSCPLSAGDTFQDPQSGPETADSTESCMYYDFPNIPNTPSIPTYL